MPRETNLEKVKKLRELTGAGFKDCSNAINENKGDIEKSIEYYGDEGDAAIFISAGGNSPNMINGAKKAKEKNFSKVITLTGNDKNNKLSKLGDINFWVDSKAYNHIENVHQVILLSLVDLIIGKSEYPPK